MRASKTWQIQEVKSRFDDTVKQTTQRNKLIDILRSAPVSLDNLELPERKVEVLQRTLL